MKLSKNIFFSAAFLLAGACVGSAATVNVSGDLSIAVDSQMTENYYVSADSTLTLNIGDTHTFYGRFLGSTSRTESNSIIGASSLASDYSDGEGYYNIGSSGGKIEITGNGTFKYDGFNNINYYSSTVLTTNGRAHGTYEQDYTESLIGINGDGNVATRTTAFSGQLTISGGATVLVGGYLSQYVKYAVPAATTGVGEKPGFSSIGFVGISNLVLKDTATISFAASEKNLLSQFFELGDSTNGIPNTGAPDGAEGVRRLNFLNNVKADINSTIELGVDEASISRILIETDGKNDEYGWDGNATVGILSGTGRVYFTSSSLLEKGTVSITNRATFSTLSENAASVPTLSLNVESEDSVLDYVHNLSAMHDLTGNKRVTTDEGTSLQSGVLADVFLLTNTILGTDASGVHVVDNVLETATAVQFETSFGLGSPYSEYYSAQVDGAVYENRSDYVPSAGTGAESVTIAGTQILNNLQSLFLERETLNAERTEGGYYELGPINSTVFESASSTSVLVSSGSTLIINQEENRDGIFSGRFYTTDASIKDLADNVGDPSKYAGLQNDGYIIKTGAGTFANISYGGDLPQAIINRLFIYEGTWLADTEALGAGRVYIGKEGSLRIVQNDLGTLKTRIEGSNLSNLIFSTDSSYTDENGVFHGGILNDDRQIIMQLGELVIMSKDSDANTYGSTSGEIQIMASQDNFYGNVEVNEDITLLLGAVGNDELDSIFSNASQIELHDDSATTKKGPATLKVVSYQILPSLIGSENTSLTFTGEDYDAVAVLTGKNQFKGKISGAGTLVKTSRGGLEISTSMHTLATVDLSGAIVLGEEGALRKSSGIVLVNGSISASTNQTFASLVGGANAGINLADGKNLTVGLDPERLLDAADGIKPAIDSYYNRGGEKIRQDAYYFATADKSRYLSDGEISPTLNGLGLSSLLSGTKAGATIDSLGSIRPAYMQEDESGNQSIGDFTVQQTIDYLKDPAKLSSVFAHLYTVIDSGTFDEMTQSSVWSDLGIAATSVKEMFDTVLDLETVKTFVAGSPVGWTERELDSLLTLAESYSSTKGAAIFVKESLSGQITLTRSGYQVLLDANAVKYLSTFGTGLSAEQLKQSETFYGFISLFVDDYKFRLTEENIGILSSVYGLPTESIVAAATDADKYNAFKNQIGLQYSENELPGFAGTISGGASLTKIGTETLRLTGQNMYTGATLVKAGELYVDYDAIQYTSEIFVADNALLTIVSDEAESKEFVIATAGVIRGSGTILKDGAGTVIIKDALATAQSGDRDFTGEIIVGKGALVVNVAGDVADEDGSVKVEGRKAFADSVNVYLNKGTVFELNVAENHEVTFGGKVVGGQPLSLSETETVTSVLAKSGAGKIIFTNGVAIADVKNEYNLAIKEGEMELQFSEDCNFRGGENISFEAVLGKSASLEFNVAEDTTTTLVGRVLAEKAGTETVFVKSGEGLLKLSLGNNDWTVDKLLLEAGTLQVDVGSKYQFNQIETAAGTTFDIEGTLVISGKESNIFNGVITGAGTLEKIGAGALELSDIQFEGTVNLVSGGLAINIGADENGTPLEKTLTFDLKVSGDNTSLTKQGVGTAILGKTVDLSGVALSVNAGTLSVDGTKLENAPKSIAVAGGATFKLDPAKDGFDMSSVEGGLSGAGTLELGDGETNLTKKETIKDFSGTFEVAQGATLALGKGINAVGGIAGSGTIAFDAAETRVALTPNRDVIFTGTLDTAPNAIVSVAGSGSLALSDGTNNATIASGVTFNVGAKGQAGSLSVGLDGGANVTLTANGSSLGIIGDVTGGFYSGSVTIANGVSDVGIALEGTVDLSNEAFAVLFPNLSGATKDLIVTLANANRENSELTLNLVGDSWDGLLAAKAEVASKAPYDFSNKNVVLATNAGGTLNLATSSTAYAYAQYSKDIGGSGNLEKSGSGELRLTSATQSYTGKTIVSKGTLAFATGTQLATSGIEVREGATLQGGVVLNAENASVSFGESACYKLDISNGESLEYKGTLSVSGEMTLDISVGQSDRGTALSIFEYIGDPEKAAGINLSQFSINSSGELLYIDTTTETLDAGNLKVYVAQDDFRKTGAELHEGIDELIDILNDWATPEGGKLKSGLSDEEKAIADALNKTSLGELGDVISNLSPLAYAAMISMPHSGFTSDVRSISSRLEQRLYDSAGAVWVYNREWECFAQVQGSTVDGGSDADSMVYDYNTYGALAGADIKLSKETTLGFAVAYDHGKADIHGNGGEIESDNIRLTGFAGFMLNDYLALNVGAQVGYADYEVERNTVLGKNKGDTDGLHGGLFADFVGAYTLYAWGENAHLDLLPHAGLALSYYRVDEFEEISPRDDFGSSLATDSFDALSLQARLGATLNCAFEIGGHAMRLGMDFSLIHEFLDDEVEIDSVLVNSEFKTEARAFSGTSLSVAPSVSFDLNEKTTVYLNYEFRVGSESETAHRANLGFRHRF